jgi:hypothetical protein
MKNAIAAGLLIFIVLAIWSAQVVARRWLALVIFGVAALILVLSIHFAAALDNGQWEGTDPAVREWHHSLMSPDIPNMPCCGEADAYWCDDYYARDDKAYCRITDTRDDATLMRPHIEVGTEIEIPPTKLKHDAGNPTGHSILFVSRSLFTYCFVQNGGV